MALWQYSFWAIPQSFMIEHFGRIKKQLTEDEFNSVHWFSKTCIDDFVSSVTYLKRSEHWDKETLFWGEYDSDSISISYEEDVIDRISLRIDLRRDYYSMASYMINSLQLCNFIVVDEELSVTSPIVENLVSSIKNSKFFGVQW